MDEFFNLILDDISSDLIRSDRFHFNSNSKNMVLDVFLFLANAHCIFVKGLIYHLLLNPTWNLTIGMTDAKQIIICWQTPTKDWRRWWWRWRNDRSNYNEKRNTKAQCFSSRMGFRWKQLSSAVKTIGFLMWVKSTRTKKINTKYRNSIWNCVCCCSTKPSVVWHGLFFIDCELHSNTIESHSAALALAKPKPFSHTE